MSKTQAKRRGKNKTKSQPPKETVRTDVWQLGTTPTQKEQMLLTVQEYRAYLRPLVLLINAQWTQLCSLSANERVNMVEKMIHATAKNPTPKHYYYHQVAQKRPSFRKFPSYLRRAAIADAIGIVSSFQTRYRDWQSGIRSSRTAKPPTLTAISHTYPALYKGQQVLYIDNYARVSLKVWNGSDWVWTSEIPVKTYGLNRHLTPGNEMQSPALVVNKKKCQLSMPIKVKKVTLLESDFVCSVDLGINNAATAAIVGKNGTVKARKFINPAKDIDCRNRRRMMIAKKSKQTANLTQEKLPKGFCNGLYRKSSHINLEISRQVATGIIKLAQEHNVKVIVLENLSGWKAKAGKKRTLLKQKFHLWCHRKIVEIVKQRWTELGGTVSSVNPKYTSAYAFDGSGKVKRSKVNYSLAKFSTGKQYHADLNGSYNIGARYWYCILMGDKNFSRVYDSKSSDGTLRTPVTLGTLRKLSIASS
jgi:IS605 OrfB family transposase